MPPMHPAVRADTTIPEAAGHEPKPDPLAGIAVDADRLAEAIRAGAGDDVSRLIADLLRAREAA